MSDCHDRSRLSTRGRGRAFSLAVLAAPAATALMLASVNPPKAAPLPAASVERAASEGARVVSKEVRPVLTKIGESLKWIFERPSIPAAAKHLPEQDSAALADAVLQDRNLSKEVETALREKDGRKKADVWKEFADTAKDKGREAAVDLFCSAEIGQPVRDPQDCLQKVVELLRR